MSLRIRMSQLAMLGLSALAGAAHALELEWGRFIGRMKASRDGAGRLLDRTMSVFGAGMGNASSHDSTDLPVLPAGDRFRHGQHLAHAPKNPPPLCTLWVQMLHELGVEVPKFGSSTSETLSGFSA